MKWLYFNQRYHPNYYASLQALIEAGHEVSFHVWSIAPEENHTGVKVTLLNQSLLSKINAKLLSNQEFPINKVFPPLSRYIKLFRNENPDIVVIRDPQRFFARLLARIASWHGAKVLFHSLNTLDTQDHRFFPRGYPIPLLKRIDAAYYSPIHGGRPEAFPPRAYFIPFAVPRADHYPKEVKTRREEFRLITIGKYRQERKRLPLLLNVLASLSYTHNISLTIIGQTGSSSEVSHMRELQQYALALGIDQRVSMMHDLPHVEVLRQYSHHDLFVLPAVNEPAGISVLEAVRNGIPAVCSDTCGVRCYLEPGATGEVFTSDDAESLKNAVLNIIKSRDEVERRKKKCWIYGEQALSHEAFLSAMNHCTMERWNLPTLSSQQSR